MEATGSQQARCLRCGRKLSAAASVARKYGRGCAAIMRAAAIAEAVKDFTADQVGKALEAIADGAAALVRPGVCRVVSSKGDGTYLTHADVCNCPAGRHERRCWHRAAVRILTAGKAA